MDCSFNKWKRFQTNLVLSRKLSTLYCQAILIDGMAIKLFLVHHAPQVGASVGRGVSVKTTLRCGRSWRPMRLVTG